VPLGVIDPIPNPIRNPILNPIFRSGSVSDSDLPFAILPPTASAIKLRSLQQKKYSGNFRHREQSEAP